MVKIATVRLKYKVSFKATMMESHFFSLYIHNDYFFAYKGHLWRQTFAYNSTLTHWGFENVIWVVIAWWKIVLILKKKIGTQEHLTLQYIYSRRVGKRTRANFRLCLQVLVAGHGRIQVVWGCAPVEHLSLTLLISFYLCSEERKTRDFSS